MLGRWIREANASYESTKTWIQVLKTHDKKSVMSLNLSLGREEHSDRRVPQVHHAISWTHELQSQWGSPIPKKKKWRASKEKYAVLNLDFTFTHTCTYTYTYLQTYVHDYIHAHIHTHIQRGERIISCIYSKHTSTLLVRIYMGGIYVWALKIKNGQGNNKIIKTKTTNKALSDLLFTTTKIWK